MTEVVIGAVFLIIVAIAYKIIKAKKKKTEHEIHADDTILPTPPKPPKATD